jgi:DNA polymerase III epsilon subunit-like protein
MQQPEIHFSVDIETAGPTPAEYAMLSIGACLVSDTEKTFYCELQPDREAADPEAMEIHGLSMDRLRAEGSPPAAAMQSFADWVAENLPENARPIFVALNAGFDWMFVNDYFHRYLGGNPFGHNALDIKAIYMGLKRIASVDAVKVAINRDYPPQRPLTHNALQDALDQARLFSKIMDELRS